MQDDEIDAKEYELFLARSFWPAFWRRWRRRKFYLTWLTIKQSYIQWRDDETDSLLWFVKSFCKGFNVYFCVGMLFCIGIAEFSYLMALHNHLNLKADDLIEPLFWALPALIGTTILDYALEFRKRPTVTLVAVFVLLALGYTAISFHACEPTVNNFYLITIGVVCLVWCIKARDPKMINLNENAVSVLPGPSKLSEFNSGPSTYKMAGKTIIVSHTEGEMK